MAQAPGPAPAIDEAEALEWLRLTFLRGFGPRERAFLRRSFERPAEIHALDASELGRVLAAKLEADPDREVLALPLDAAAQLGGRGTLDEGRAELSRIRDLGLELWTLADPRYPELLAEADDPPWVLTARGSLRTVPRRTVSIVGSRRAKQFECRFARDLARDLAAQGIVVASGLAKGIDRAAHEGALSVHGGQTVAVLGCGLARVYPTEHAELAQAIVERGALVSELPVDAPPRKHHFPRRNRIVSGIAAATVVIAAGEGSGALITAGHALDQGREVLTIPGRLDDPLARGANELLKDGRAALLEGVDDVLRALGWKHETPGADVRPPIVSVRPVRPRLPGLPGEVESLLAGGAARSFEDLAIHGRFEPRLLLVALGRLEGLGRVRARGGYYELAW